MDQPPNPALWDAYYQRVVLQENNSNDEHLTPSFDGLSRMDLYQYDRSSESPYVSQSLSQPNNSSLRNWDGVHPLWSKLEPGPRSSTSTMLSLGPLTPGITGCDGNDTINPDSLVKAEAEFGNNWSFGYANTPQDLIVPISPTSPSRAPHRTPNSSSDGQFEGSSSDYFDSRPNGAMPIQSRSGSMLSPSELQDSLSHGQLSPHLQFSPSIIPPTLSSSVDNTEAIRKRGSLPDAPVQSKRRRSKTSPNSKHNQIEKRYRTNLNEKISALRDSVPSLRAMMDVDGEDGRCSGGEDSDEDSRAAGAPTQRRRSIAKAEVLSKAAEYIHDLEKKNAQIEKEKQILQAKIDASEASEALRGKKRGK